MTLLDPQSEWAHLLMRTFADAGVTDIVISPGSRSTPFVLAAANESRLRACTIVDERAAAFFALGQARASGRPSLLLCTSGTAPAHYLPAILEAHATHTPLLVLSADRPLETQGAGAPQTIDQIKLYGDAALRYFELGGVDAAPSALRGMRRMVAHAVALCHEGPVHLNVRAKKPLEPHAPTSDSAAIRAAGNTATPRVHLGGLSADASGLQRLAARIAEEPEGIFVVGPLAHADRALLEPLVRLAARAGYPILAEATSQLGGPDVLVGALGVIGVRESLRPRLVIQVGPPPIATAYERLLHGPQLEILARDLAVDAESRAAAVHVCDPIAACALLDELLSTRGLDRESTWSARWRKAAASVAKISPAETSELAMVRALLDALPAVSLMVGNSLPVREIDLACALGAKVPSIVLHQRGVSGIDGLVAGASGAASVLGATVLLLGDISLLHDLHGLLVASQRTEPLVVAVLANGGGRIFDALPIGKRADLAPAMPLFTTPAQQDLAALARFTGARYARVEAPGSIRDVLGAALAHRGATLLELVVDPNSAATLDAALPGLVDAALTEAGL